MHKKINFRKQTTQFRKYLLEQILGGKELNYDKNVLIFPSCNDIMQK